MALVSWAWLIKLMLTKCLPRDRTFKTAGCDDHAFEPRVLAVSATIGLSLSAAQIQYIGKQP